MGMEIEAMDFVIPWVDGSDPAWRAERELWFARECRDPYLAKWNDGEQRYRDNGLLRYWFRGVEKFAPWVKRIHFVTWGHLPPWLKVNHPKLHVVRHEDFIPREYRPTFSSRCIDLNLHRIPDLAERFVYFNDDIFLTAPVTPSDFFRKGLPCDAAIISPLYLKQNGVRAEINALYAVNEHFRKRDVILRHPLKWFSPRYGTALVRTLTQLPYGLFTGFYVHHGPVSYLKATFDEVWRAEPDLLRRSCSHRFRNDGDVNQWIMEYWQYCTGMFSPRSPSFSSMYEHGDVVEAAVADIVRRRHKALCWNDSAETGASGAAARIAAAFGETLGTPCEFENEGTSPSHSGKDCRV